MIFGPGFAQVDRNLRLTTFQSRNPVTVNICSEMSQRSVLSTKYYWLSHLDGCGPREPRWSQISTSPFIIIQAGFRHIPANLRACALLPLVPHYPGLPGTQTCWWYHGNEPVSQWPSSGDIQETTDGALRKDEISNM